MAEEFKKQHIVPQSYLSRFAVHKKADTAIMGVRLQCETVPKPKFFLSSAADVAYRNNYYDTYAQQDEKFWEHYMDRNFDRLCGRPLKNIISSIMLSLHCEKVLTETHKDVLARIILSQSIRVPTVFEGQLNRSNEIISSYKDFLITKYPNLDSSKIEAIKNIEFSADDRKNIVLEAMFDKSRFSRFCEILKQKTWVVYYNTIADEIPYVTSDNPVMYAEFGSRKDGLIKIGLLSERLVVLFPITPRLLIGIYSPELYFGMLSRYDSKVICIDDAKFVIKLNVSIINQSYVHSFLPNPLYDSLKNVNQQ